MKRFELANFNVKDPKTIKKMLTRLAAEPSRLVIDDATYYVSKMQVVPDSVTSEQYESDLSDLRGAYESELDILRAELQRNKEEHEKERQSMQQQIDDQSESELVKSLNRDYLSIYNRISDFEKQTESNQKELRELKEIAFKALKRIRG